MMKTKTKAPSSTKIALPKGILESDCGPDKVYGQTETDYTAGDSGNLHLHYIPEVGWVVATLFISRSSSAKYIDRTYGIVVETGKTVRIGGGPHITSTIVVRLRKNRIEALSPFIEMYDNGMGKAGSVRDRISTRRAQGVEHRAAGKTSWHW